MLNNRNNGKTEIVGSVVYYRKFRSRYPIAERDLLVWLPPSYKNDKSRHFPVLYMHDGQNLIDPLTSFAGRDWRVDESVTRLIRTGQIEEIMVVGIYNTRDRLEEYSESEKGDYYLKFIAEELKVFIDNNFRTLPDREASAIMGSSMGGLCSLRMIWEYPHVFGMAGCLSSSFYHGNGAIFKRIESSKGRKNMKIYIDSGEDGKKDAQKMFCLLTSKGFVLGEELDYYFDRGAGHNEDAWADRLERPLRFMFGK